MADPVPGGDKQGRGGVFQGRVQPVLRASGDKGLDQGKLLGADAGDPGPEHQTVQQRVGLPRQIEPGGKLSLLGPDGPHQGDIPHPPAAQVLADVGGIALALDVDLYPVDAVELAEGVHQTQHRQPGGILPGGTVGVEIAVEIHGADAVFHRDVQQLGAGRQGRMEPGGLRPTQKQLQHELRQSLLGQGPDPAGLRNQKALLVREIEDDLRHGAAVIEEDAAVHQLYAVRHLAVAVPDLDAELPDPVQAQGGFRQADKGQGALQGGGGLRGLAQQQLQGASRVQTAADQVLIVGEGGDQRVAVRLPGEVKAQQVQPVRVRIGQGADIQHLRPQHPVLRGEIRGGGPIIEGKGLQHGGGLLRPAAGGQQHRDQQQDRRPKALPGFHGSSSFGMG